MAQLNPVAIITAGKTPLTDIDGGIIMAINIAYSAIPKALVTVKGKDEPASAPKRVPKDQPTYGNITSPKKYFLFIRPCFEDDTAKISSVINAEKKNLSLVPKEPSSFCDKVKLINKYLEFITS